VIDYDELDVGIRETVRWLRDHGFNTCDSGDGSKAVTMDCAESVPNVHMLSTPALLVDDADHLDGLLRQRGVAGYRIQATYAPGEPAVLSLYDVNDELMKESAA
jgi:hypothetical protein